MQDYSARAAGYSPALERSTIGGENNPIFDVESKGYLDEQRKIILF